MMLSDFPDDSRIWIYGFRQRLMPTEKKIVESALSRFVSNWKSHGEPVEGGFIILHDQFVILAAKPTTGISGCSIDSSVAVFKKLREHYGLDALDRSFVFFRKEGDIVSVDREAFDELIKSGKVGTQTPVFDLTLTSLGHLRAGLMERPLHESWLGPVFGETHLLQLA